MDYFISADRLDMAAKLFGPQPAANSDETNYSFHAMLMLKHAGVDYVEKWNRNRLSDGIRTINYAQGKPCLFYEVRGFDYTYKQWLRLSDYDWKNPMPLLPDIRIKSADGLERHGSVCLGVGRGRRVSFPLSPTVEAFASSQTPPVPLSSSQAD